MSWSFALVLRCTDDDRGRSGWGWAGIEDVTRLARVEREEWTGLNASIAVGLEYGGCLFTVHPRILGSAPAAGLEGGKW